MEKKVAILLADLSGYTAMTDVHGGESAAMLVKKYMTIVNRSLVGSTKVIQRVGDQIVLLAERPTDIVSSAQQLIRLIFEEHQFLSICGNSLWTRFYRKRKSVWLHHKHRLPDYVYGESKADPLLILPS